MTATVVYLQNALVPSARRVEQSTGRSLQTLAPAWQTPFVCFVDGRPVLRAEWELVPDDEQNVAFIDAAALPQGGGNGGSDPLRMILTLAVMVFAPQIAFSVFGAAGVTAAAFAASTLGILTTAGVSLVGMALVNAVLPPPKAPSPQQAAALAAPSPTYSIGAQGNTARIDGAIPEHFGRVKAYLDFAAQPYTEFAGNEQYLYQLLCVGRGVYDIEQLLIGDAPITSFADITFEVIEPGASVTKFPANVITSPDVSGSDLIYNVFTGGSTGFVPNAYNEATNTNFIGLDFVAPRGLYYANDDGSLAARSVTVQVEFRAVSPLGVLLGTGWSTLLNKTYTAATTTPQRYSERIAVSPGRYAVRVARTSVKDTASRVGNDLSWTGLRAYLTDTRTYGDVTLIAVRLQATNNLTSNSARQLNVIATRKLPIWTGTAWTAPTVTRNPAWAMAYAAKQAGLVDAQIDITGLLNLSTLWASRGDNLDARFDNFMSFWEAAQKILAVGRAKPYMQGGVLRFTRDSAATIPVAMFSTRNIVKGSLNIDFIMPTADSADSVDVKYFDDTVWRQATVRATLAGSTAATPAKVELFGVTGRAHAHREGLYQAATNRYRRKIIKFKTEMEGFIPSFGDLITIQHDMPGWGQSGEVVAYNAGTRTLTLSDAVNFTTGNHYIAVRRRDGSVDGPHLVTAGGAVNQVVVAAGDPLTITPFTGQTEERTHFAFGPGTAWSQRARVVSVRPSSINSAEIEAVNEDDNVHTADSGITTPALVTSSLAQQTNVPVVTGLLVVPSPFDPSRLVASWSPAPWSDRYVLELSVDGVVWNPIGDVSSTSLTFDSPATSCILRVAAVGLAKGPWVTTNIIVLAPDVVTGLALEGVFDTTACRIKWNPVFGAKQYRVEVRTGSTLRRTVLTSDARFSYTSEDARSDGGLARSLFFTVYSIGQAGLSTASSVFTATNAQIAIPSNASVEVGIGNLVVRADTPPDTDYAGTLIWRGTATGFTRDASTLIYDGKTPNTVIPVPSGDTVWFAMAHYDVFGKDSLNYSGYFSATSGSAGGVQVTNTTPGTTYLGQDLVYSTPAQSLFKWNAALSTPAYQRAQPEVVANQITTIDLKAISANVGELFLGRMRLDAFGYMRGGQTDFNAGSGFWLGYKTGEYKFSVGNDLNDRMTFDSTGLKVFGQMTIASANEVPVSLNGTFPTLTGWFQVNTAGTAFEAATTASGASIETFESDTRLSGSNFIIYSAKFAVNDGELFRFKMDVRLDFGVTQVFAVYAYFDSNATLGDPAVGLSGTVVSTVTIAQASRDSTQTDAVQWVEISGSFVVPATAKWASIVVSAAT